MAYGLQVWDSSNNIILDTSDRFVFFKAIVTGSSLGNTYRDHTVSGVNATDYDFAYTYLSGTQVIPPTVVISTNNVRVTNVGYANNGNLSYAIAIIYNAGL